MNVEVKLECPVPISFRTQKAANSCDIDIEKKSVHTLSLKDIDIHSDFKIGLILGASGSGKSTLAKKLFGDDCFKSILDEARPIIDQFPDKYTYDECVNFLNGIGLTQVPCWIRPAYTLSNGQKARAEAALLMSQDQELIIIDEWTSVVDRNVAKVMSFCLNKFAQKYNKKIVLCSCHYDIIEWLKPDWIIDCSRQEYQNYRGSLWQRQEQLDFQIRECDRSTWKYFSKYHYLSENLPGGKIYCFGLFQGPNQIGFQCFANYVPNQPKVFHFNRTVIHPDFCGFGLGVKLVNITSEHVRKNYGLTIRGKFSSLPMLKALLKNENWRFIETNNNVKKVLKDRSGVRKAVKTYTFEYIGSLSK